MESPELVEFLTQRGYGEEDIARILAKLADYDKLTIADSIFDSIEKGSFDLESIIDEALAGRQKDN